MSVARPSLEPTAEDLDRERACKAAGVAWAVRSYRGTAGSALERLRQLRREGRLYDETNPTFHHWADR